MNHLICMRLLLTIRHIISQSLSLYSPIFSLNRKNNVPEKLEVDPSKRRSVDIANIVPRDGTREGPLEAPRVGPPAAMDHLSEGFVDDPEVPPLI